METTQTKTKIETAAATTGTNTKTTNTTETIKNHFCCEKKGFCRKGIIFILAGFIALGAATGHILWDYDLPKLCGKILLGTGLAGLGIGLLVAGFFLLHIYKRYDEHYLNNL
jgi:hypothetical protein